MTETRPCKRRYDAIVIGARCAGASTAMLLARAGANVLLIDRQAYGTDRLSTHALMRGGVLQLHRWGLLPEIVGAETPAIRQTVFHYANEEIRIGIKPDHGVEYLCAPRRTVLDRVLVDAAARAGADIRHGVSLNRVHTATDGRVTGVRLQDPTAGPIDIQARIVIGADGRQSLVARQMGAQTYATARHFSAAFYGYFSALPDDGFHWYYQDKVSAGVIPTNGRQHCVFVCVPNSAFTETFRDNVAEGFFRTLDANSRGLGTNLRQATLTGRLRGFAGAPGHMRTSHGRGWALVGDAGYFKDPLTAHGITDALRDAEILSSAVLQGSDRALARYQEERDVLSAGLFAVTDRIASFDWDMPEIKSLHKDLNDAMKSEVDHMAATASRASLAA